MRIAVIPARGGSRRIPGKNIRAFCGRPIIGWTIESVRSSGLFEHAIVSTDDAAIRSVALEYGAECPFVRPAKLADDWTGTVDVIAHATQWAIDAGWRLDAVCCIYPTAPFVQADDLNRGLNALLSGDWAYVFAATDFDAPFFRAFRQREDGGVEMFFPEHQATRSQDLPPVLHDAGQFYWGRPSAWLERTAILDRRSLPLVIPRGRVQDIDSPGDWARAEAVFQHLRGLRA